MRRLGIRNGLKVSELSNGKLKSAGVREGFIIVRVDRKEVKGLQDVIKILDQKSDAVLIEGIYPNGITAYYGFGM
jgi:type II secretory pathway component GspD/PulD (secretin)